MKHFTTPNQLQLDSIKLGEKIIKDNFKPDYLVALWRGGATIGCYVHELLKYVYNNIDHIAIRTSRYEGQQAYKVQVHNLGYLCERLKADSKVIIIDDVYDTGLSIQAVFESLKEKLGDNMPVDIRVATIDYKPTRNRTDRIPDYYVNLSNEWLVYPHELEGLTIQEIHDFISPEISDIVASCKIHCDK